MTSGVVEGQERDSNSILKKNKLGQNAELNIYNVKIKVFQKPRIHLAVPGLDKNICVAGQAPGIK